MESFINAQRVKALLTAIICIVTIVSCGGERTENTKSRAPTIQPMTDSRKETTPTHTYYFEMQEEALNAFSNNMSRIKIGDTRKQVVDILGSPIYDDILTKKEDSTFLWRVLDYYTKIWKKDLVNEKYDQKVSLYFNQSDQLVRIRSNVSGINSRE